MCIRDSSSTPAAWQNACTHSESGRAVNLLDVPVERAGDVTDTVFGIVSAHGGSISAEHGIGRAKARWTHLGRSDVDLDAMRAIKSALDPQWLLNPGVIFG